MPDVNVCVDRLKVLADATRLEVVRALLSGPLHAGSLQRQTGVEQSLLSHHLRVLREAGLVKARRDGKAVLYRLAEGVALRPETDGLDLGCCTLSFDSTEVAS